MEKLTSTHSATEIFSLAQNKLTFIDLFAGVGGFHLALTQASHTKHKIKARCVFASEINKQAQITYALNFPKTPLYGDITQDSTQSHIPKSFDILCAGFPCQAFSIVGKQEGFNDTRGALFFEIANILKAHRPKALMLENVKNLLTHNNGKTYATICHTLESLGYAVYAKVLDSALYANIPQHRERIFIVCFDKNQVKNHKAFSFPKPLPLTTTIHDCIHTYKPSDTYYYNKQSRHYELLMREVKQANTLYQLRRTYVRENKSKLCPTLTANMGGGGHNVPLIKDKWGIRKLTPRECFYFQGYPSSFRLPHLSNSALYTQAGNSITLPLLRRVSERVIQTLKGIEKK